MARHRALLSERSKSAALRPWPRMVVVERTARFRGLSGGSRRIDPRANLLHAAERRGASVRYRPGDADQRAAAKRAANHREPAAIGAGAHGPDSEPVGHHVWRPRSHAGVADTARQFHG